MTDALGEGQQAFEDDWDDDDAYDVEAEEDDYAGACKHGGPAPCIDDICHALGGCMHWRDYQP